MCLCSCIEEALGVRKACEEYRVYDYRGRRICMQNKKTYYTIAQ